MTDLMSIACPECGVLSGRYCDPENQTNHITRAAAATRADAAPVFHWSNGYITGPGGISLLAPTGEAALGADELNRVVALLRDLRLLGDDGGAKIVAQHKRERARIEAAKADLAEDLGIEIGTRNYVQKVECKGPGPLLIRTIRDGEIKIEAGAWVDVEQDEQGRFVRVVGRGTKA